MKALPEAYEELELSERLRNCARKLPAGEIHESVVVTLGTFRDCVFYR